MLRDTAIASSRAVPSPGASSPRVPVTASSPGLPRGRSSRLTDALPPLDTTRLLLSFKPPWGHRTGLRSARVAAQPICCPACRPWGAARASPASGLLGPRLMSAGRSDRIAPPSVPCSLDYRQISQGQTPNVLRVDAGLIKHTPADGGLRGHVPARPGCPTPPLRFLCVASHVWIGLSPDPPSRWTPLPFSSPSAPR